jgi:chaperonin cofactor prefoldin
MSEGKAEIKASISELEIVRQNKSAVETKLKEIQAELKEFQ